MSGEGAVDEQTLQFYRSNAQAYAEREKAQAYAAGSLSRAAAVRGE